MGHKKHEHVHEYSPNFIEKVETKEKLRYKEGETEH